MMERSFSNGPDLALDKPRFVISGNSRSTGYERRTKRSCAHQAWQRHVPFIIVTLASDTRKLDCNSLILLSFIKMPYLWAGYWKPCPSRLWRIRPGTIHKVIHSSCGQLPPPPKALLDAVFKAPRLASRMDTGLQRRTVCKPCLTRLADHTWIHIQFRTLQYPERPAADMQLSPVRQAQVVQPGRLGRIPFVSS